MNNDIEEGERHRRRLYRSRSQRGDSKSSSASRSPTRRGGSDSSSRSAPIGKREDRSKVPPSRNGKSTTAIVRVATIARPTPTRQTECAMSAKELQSQPSCKKAAPLLHRVRYRETTASRLRRESSVTSSHNIPCRGRKPINLVGSRTTPTSPQDSKTATPRTSRSPVPKTPSYCNEEPTRRSRAMSYDVTVGQKTEAPKNNRAPSKHYIQDYKKYLKPPLRTQKPTTVRNKAPIPTSIKTKLGPSSAWQRDPGKLYDRKANDSSVSNIPVPTSRAYGAVKPIPTPQNTMDRKPYTPPSIMKPVPKTPGPPGPVDLEVKRRSSVALTISGKASATNSNCSFSPNKTLKSQLQSMNKGSRSQMQCDQTPDQKTDGCVGRKPDPLDEKMRQLLLQKTKMKFKSKQYMCLSSNP